MSVDVHNPAASVVRPFVEFEPVGQAPFIHGERYVVAAYHKVARFGARCVISNFSFYAGEIMRFDQAVFYIAELGADAGERYGFEQVQMSVDQCRVDMHALQVNDPRTLCMRIVCRKVEGCNDAVFDQHGAMRVFRAFHGMKRCIGEKRLHGVFPPGMMANVLLFVSEQSGAAVA